MEKEKEKLKEKTLSNIFKATQENEASKLIEILNSGQNPNQTDIYGFTPLHYCTIFDNFRGAKILIQKGALVDLTGGELNYTPLHIASIVGSSIVAQLLIKNGADPNKKDSQGFSPIHLAAQNNHHLFCHILISNGVSFNEVDNQSRTALHWAVLKNHIRVARYFIYNHADISIQDNDGCTPLHWAILLHRPEITKILLKNKSDLRIKDHYNSTPRDCALETQNFKTIMLIDHIQKIKKQKYKIFSPKQLSLLGFTLFFFAIISFLSIFPLFLNLLIIPLFTKMYFRFFDPILKVSEVDYSSFATSASFLVLFLSTSIFRIIPKCFSHYPKIVFIFLISVAILIYKFLITSLRDPGKIPQKIINPEELIQEENPLLKYHSSFLEKNFCETCRIFQPLRSKHDSTLQRCISRYDHFCSWTSNAVGEKNHSTFLSFISFSIISFVFYFILSLLFLLNNHQITQSSFEFFHFLYLSYFYQPWIFFLSIFSLVLLIWIIFLFIEQFLNISNNITLNERINQVRYIHFWKNQRQHNPFDLGSIYKNILQFFKLNYSVDWSKIFWFDDLKYGDCQHLKSFLIDESN
ncbi:palmitoyltransferase hip14 [Anaeramoeba ignava]|uniref:Palmitoyltransferase n=1 Tax=Anaeramoeba ignava TaxID=1746090 RepID=A0A9Q0LH41_ANAIG|nr:palmitoyltransferase hip14 [Anaeramoeba ignava]